MKLLCSLVDLQKNGGKFHRKPRHFVSCSADVELTDVYPVKSYMSFALHSIRLRQLNFVQIS